MNPGERVGDYEIVEILGAGGMGQVYKVRNVLSDRIEAMKILLPVMGGNTELGNRFLREIKVQAALDHPNIARLYTAQQIGDQLLMFIEFVDGASIDKPLQQGPLSLNESVRCASEVLDALSYAHGRGVVHRDIKPANIMRTSAGGTKLMDFGIAKMQTDRHLTKTGTAVGSLYYMSPEQINGAEPDPRSDLYSLGITLYEMVTGRKPFQGDSDYSIMAGHLQQVPAAPIEVVPGIPGDLNDIILLAIAKDPQQRFQSADAFRKALSSIAGLATPVEVLAPAPPAAVAIPVASPPRSRRGLYMALGSVATLVVFALAIWQGPKYLHVHAGAAASPAEAQISSTPAAPQPALPDNPAPTVTPAPAAAPVVPDPIASAPPPPSDRAVTSKPAAPPRQSRRVQAQVPSAQPVAPSPVQAAAPETPPPAPAQAAPAGLAPATAAELNDLRKQYNDLSIRASSAKVGLHSIQRQMQSQGLNLRTDILEAESRVDYLMKEAMDSIRSGNADEARGDLQMAELSLQTIQKFLGH
ncbi:MAG: serine/threonine protein kinase [Bryobacteraceae bacterium]